MMRTWWLPTGVSAESHQSLNCTTRSSLDREEVANAKEGHAGFGGSAHLVRELGSRYFPVEHLVEIEAIHA